MSTKGQLQDILLDEQSNADRTPENSIVETVALENRTRDFFNFDLENYIISGIEGNMRELRTMQLRVYDLQRYTAKSELNMHKVRKIVRWQAKQRI